MNKELSKYLVRLTSMCALLLSTFNGPVFAAPPPVQRFGGAGSQTQTTFTDFNQACATPLSTRATTRDGEGVELAAQFSDSFVGTTLDLTTRWDEGEWGTVPFTPTVGGGRLTLPAAPVNGQGGWVRSKPKFTRGVLEAVAEFGAGNSQHIGFGGEVLDQRYFIFSTYNDPSKLFARVSNDATEQRVEVGNLPVGLHRYRIEWAAHPTFPLSDTITFYLDEAQVAAFVIDNNGAQNFHAYTSNDGTAPWQVDSLQVMPSYAANGTYESCVFDAGDMHVWDSVNWNALTPISGTLAVETRSAFDQNNWSSWTQVLTSTGSSITPLKRYAQYRLTFATTDVITSPLLEAITLNYSPATLALAMNDRNTVTATIGSPVNYTLNVTVPQTQTYGLVVTHTLPAGVKYNSLVGVTTAGTVQSPTVSASSPNDGSAPVTVQLDFGNAAFITPTASITIPTIVANAVGNQAGLVLTASTSASYKNEVGATQLIAPITDAFVVVEPALTISKTISSVASPFTVNSLVRYQVVVSHPGGANTSPAYDVILGDLVPAALTLQTPITISVAGGAGGYTSSVITNTVAVTITSIPASGTVTLSLAARLNNGAQPNQIVTNTAGVLWTSRAGANVDERTGLGDINDYVALSSIPATVQMPDMALALTDGDASLTVGVSEPLTYTLTYQNLGNFAAPGVVITETLPAGTTFNAALSPVGWNCVSSTCTYSLGTVAAGITGTVKFVITVNAMSVPLVITNTASIGTNGANGPEATLTNNSATETTPGFYRLYLPLIAKAP